MITFFKNISFIKFIIVGIINTAIGMALMFFFYSVLMLGYWASSFISYIIASLISYFLNKKITFESNVGNKTGIIKFFLLISVCYFLAYSIARPFVFFTLQFTNFSAKEMEQIALFTGMIFFSILNYVGQKLWVFK